MNLVHPRACQLRSIPAAMVWVLAFGLGCPLRAQSMVEVLDEERLRSLQRTSVVGDWLNDEKVGWSSFSWEVGQDGAEPVFVAEEQRSARNSGQYRPGRLDTWKRLEFRLSHPQRLVGAAETIDYTPLKGPREIDEWTLANAMDGAARWHRRRREDVQRRRVLEDTGTPASGPRVDLLLADSIHPGTRLWFVLGPQRHEFQAFQRLDVGRGTLERIVAHRGRVTQPEPGGKGGGAPFYRLFYRGFYWRVHDDEGWVRGGPVLRSQPLHVQRKEDPDVVHHLFGDDRMFSGRTESIGHEADLHGRNMLAISVPAAWAEAFAEDEHQWRRNSNDRNLALWILHSRAPYPERISPLHRASWLWMEPGEQVDWKARTHAPWTSAATPGGLELVRHLMTQARPATETTTALRCDPTVSELLEEGCVSSADCARVLVAAARYFKLPARTVKGLAFSMADRAFLPRSWCEIYVDGAWHSVDPYVQQMPPDATHLRLAPVSDAFLARLKPLERPLIRFE